MSDSPEHDVDKIVLQIGHVTIAWAYLDVSLDLCISAIYGLWDGASIEAERPRTAFSRKTAFLKKAFAPGTKIAASFPDSLEIIERLDPAAEYRNAIIHGAALDINEIGMSGAMKMRSHKWVGTDIHITEITVDTEALISLRNYALGLARFMFALAQLLALQIGRRNDLDQARSELPVEFP